MVWIKIVSLGVIISFFYGTTTGSKSLPVPLSYLVWIIPLAAVIFDMLIASNLRVINNLGHYIKKYIENGAFTKFKEEINISKPTEQEGKNTLLDWITHPISLLIELIGGLREPDETESESKFKFWEEAAAQAELKYHCYTAEDMLGIWLFTVASWGFCVLFRYPFGFVDVVLAAVCGMGIIFALIYLIRSITMKRRF